MPRKRPHVLKLLNILAEAVAARTGESIVYSDGSSGVHGFSSFSDSRLPQQGALNSEGVTTEASTRKHPTEKPYSLEQIPWIQEIAEAVLRRFNPEARTRYVTDEEYQSRIELARGRGRHDIVAAMELAYLCRMRMGEIVQMRADQVGADGLLVKRTKGSKTQRVEWSVRLQDAVRLAQDATRRAMTAHLLVSSSSGLPLTLRALQGAWNQLRKVAQDRGDAVDWTFHDIKAKGVSDFDGDKHLASGHKTQRMTAVYNRVPDKVGSTR